MNDNNNSAESMKQLGGQKIFAHLDRLAEWQAGRLPPPVTVELDLTNHCNHECPGCTFSYLVNVSKAQIERPLAVRIVNELADFGVKALTFSGGGEPLVYGEQSVLALMDEAKARGLDVALITNGSLLRDRGFLDLCEWIRVSLDGYDADTFARFHGRNDKEFGKVVGNVRALCSRARDLRGAGGKTATLGAGFLTDETSVAAGHIGKMTEFCAGIDGLDYVQFRPLVLNMVADPSLRGGCAWFNADCRDGILRQHRAAQTAFARPDFRVLLSLEKYEVLAKPQRPYARCLAHFMEATISADAKVYICCHGQGLDQFCLGDLRTNSFAEIWHSDRARYVYESIRPGEHCPPACRLHAQNITLHGMQEFVHPNFI